MVCVGCCVVVGLILCCLERLVFLLWVWCVFVGFVGVIWVLLVCWGVFLFWGLVLLFWVCFWFGFEFSLGVGSNCEVVFLTFHFGVSLDLFCELFLILFGSFWVVLLPSLLNHSAIAQASGTSRGILRCSMAPQSSDEHSLLKCLSFPNKARSASALYLTVFVSTPLQKENKLSEGPSSLKKPKERCGI